MGVDVTVLPYDPEKWPEDARANVVAGIDITFEVDPPEVETLTVVLGPGWDPAGDAVALVHDEVEPRVKRLLTEDGVAGDWLWLEPDHAWLILVRYDLPDMGFLDGEET